MARTLPLLLALAAGCRPAVPPTTPAPAAVEPVAAGGLHNVFRVSGRVFSGSGPEGDADFAALKALGVRTVISVDGAKPDVAAAGKHGLRYVHIPVGYDGIPRGKALAIARAVRDLPGPVYVHCHHGQHRGPAAVAAAQLCLDPAWTPEFAEAWLKAAGTDPRYAGLVGLPRSLARPTADELDRAAADFPAVAAVPDFTRMMVEIDARWDHLKDVKAAGWERPAGHPDIDPPHEALQLVELYREAARLPSASGRGPEFLPLLTEAESAAGELERALRESPPNPDRTATAFTRSASVCSRCHVRFRDRPPE